MTDDNSNLVDMDDQDAFEKEFFQLEDLPEDDEVDENEEDSLAPDEDEDADEEDVEAPSEDEDEDEEEEEDEDSEPEPKPKPKSKAQKRIEELVTEARVAQRERDAERREREMLESRLAEVEARNKVNEPSVKEQLPPEAPMPDAVDDKGNPIYPLGEFDPKFIADLTKFTIDQQWSEKQKLEKEAEEARQIEAQRNELTKEWQQKVAAVEEELPDFREKVVSLTEAFANVEPSYGEYLATTIMSCDNGPEIMYYLSQNIGEAQNIVASGPFAATLAIAKIDAKLAKSAKAEEKSNKQKRVSDAPPPPTNRTRGKGGQFAVAPDTDDLDAFEKEFFKTKY